MNVRKKIAVDLDEVIADGTMSLCMQINELNGTKFSPKDWHAIKRQYEGFYIDFPKRKGLKHGIESLTSDMTKHQGHVPLKPGARETLSRLAENYDLYLLTARKLSWKAETMRWLSENFEGMFTDIIFAREHKYGPHKMDICHALGISHMVDDRIEYLYTNNGARHTVTPVLFGDYAWHIEIPGYYKRCKSWKELHEYFAKELQKTS